MSPRGEKTRDPSSLNVLALKECERACERNDPSASLSQNRFGMDITSLRTLNVDLPENDADLTEV